MTPSTNQHFPVPSFSTDEVQSRLNKSILDSLPEQEQRARVQLAACYRIFAHFNWTDMIYNHITARVSPSEFLINPFGLLYGEITASSLLKVDHVADKVTGRGVVGDLFEANRAGYVIHSAVHESRPDIVCVAHCHQADVVAVSCDKRGLLPSNQQALQLGEITYHDYEGIVVDEAEKERLKKDLGTRSKVMMLRNHGVLTLGESIGEALLLMHYVVEACKIQVKQGPSCDLVLPSDKIAQKTHRVVTHFNKEGVGQKELAAHMRKLDKTDTSYRL